MKVNLAYLLFHEALSIIVPVESSTQAQTFVIEYCLLVLDGNCLFSLHFVVSTTQNDISLKAWCFEVYCESFEDYFQKEFDFFFSNLPKKLLHLLTKQRSCCLKMSVLYFFEFSCNKKYRIYFICCATICTKNINQKIICFYKAQYSIAVQHLKFQKKNICIYI